MLHSKDKLATTLRQMFHGARRFTRRVTSRAREVLHKSTLPPALADVAGAVRTSGLTYLSPMKLDKLGAAVLRIEARGVPGAIIETGCALGGSAILMASAKARSRPMRVYDVFGMIPPPSAADDVDVHRRYAVIQSGRSKGLRGDTYYGYQKNVLEQVKQSFARFALDEALDLVEFVPGLIEDTLVATGPVALAHIDVDWHAPVKTSLERILPQLSPGGVVVLDDYFDWSGCHRATDEVLAATSIRFERDASSGSLALWRVSP